MRSLRNCIIALLIGCCMPLLIWVGLGASLGDSFSLRQARRLKEAWQNKTCTLDTDCPPGFMCEGGRCVPAK